MSDDVYCLRIAYFSSPPNPDDAMVSDGTIDANKCPVCPISNLLSPNNSYSTIDFAIINNSFCSCRVTHAESKDKANIYHAFSIRRAMSSRGDDIGCN